MKSKKAIKLSLENLAIIILSLLCILILVLVLVRVISINSSKPDLQKAQESMDLITQKLYSFKGDNTLEDSLIIYPPLDWYLKSYFQNFPQGECLNNKYCLCMCYNYKCNSEKKCQGFDFSIGISYGEVKYTGVIPFKNSVEELKLNKTYSMILISLNEKK